MTERCFSRSPGKHLKCDSLKAFEDFDLLRIKSRQNRLQNIKIAQFKFITPYDIIENSIRNGVFKQCQK